MSELQKCMRALEAAGQSQVKKSLNGKHVTAEVARALAITKASEAQPELTRHILNLERQRVMKANYSANYSWLMKGSAPAYHGAPDEDDLLEELKKIRRKEAAIVERIRLGRAEAGLDDDDWSSEFSEA